MLFGKLLRDKIENEVMVLSINRDLRITIKDDLATLDSKLYVYQNDKDIDLYFSLSNYEYKFRQNISDSPGLDNVSYCSATIVRPNGTSFKKQPLYIVSDRIKFPITQDLTDELTEIGEYKLQFHLYDDTGARVTIPYISFYVKELIANETVLNLME